MPIKFKRGDLDSLAREIRSLSREMKQDTFFSLITLAEVINKYLILRSKVEGSRVGESHFSKVAVLNALVLNNGCMTSKMLSKKVYRTKYAISKIIDKLEGDGLVLMEQPISGDRRFKKVFITQKGIEFLRKRMPERRRLAKEAVSILNTDEIYVLGKLSRKLKKHLLERTAGF